MSHHDDDETKKVPIAAYVKACWSIFIATWTVLFVSTSFSFQDHYTFADYHYELSFTDDGANPDLESCVIPAAKSNRPPYIYLSYDQQNGNYPWLVCNDVRFSTGFIGPSRETNTVDNSKLSARLLGSNSPVPAPSNNGSTERSNDRDESMNDFSQNMTGAWTSEWAAAYYCPRNYHCSRGADQWKEYGFSDLDPSYANSVFCIHKTLTCGNKEWCGRLRLDPERRFYSFSEAPPCENCISMGTLGTIAITVLFFAIPSTINTQLTTFAPCPQYSCFPCSLFLCAKKESKFKARICMHRFGKYMTVCDFVLDIVLLCIILASGIALYFKTYEKSDCLGPEATNLMLESKSQAEFLTWNILTLGVLEIVSLLIHTAEFFSFL